MSGPTRSRRDGGPRPQPAAGAGAAAAPGRRQPLPPRHRRRAGRRLAADRGGARAGRRGRRHPDRADRLRPARAPGGRSRPRERHDALVAGVALHPNEAPRLAEAGGSTRRSPRSRRSPAPATGCAPWGRPGSTTSAPARRAGPRSRRPFRRHIDLAKRLDKTLVIHDRDAHDDVLRDPRRGGRRRTGSSCTASPATPTFARACLDRGACLSFAGTVTFKNAEPLREALRVVPARPGPGGDRRAVPHADAAPRPAQRVLPGAADGALDGRDPRGRPGGAVRGGRRQHRGGLRRLLVAPA